MVGNILLHNFWLNNLLQSYQMIFLMTLGPFIVTSIPASEIIFYKYLIERKKYFVFKLFIIFTLER